MKKIVLIAAILVAAVACCFFLIRYIGPKDYHVVTNPQFPAWKSKGTVIVDAGHGGFDGGASSKDKKYVEKDINLQIAQQLELSLLQSGYTVVMTRESDTALSNTKKGDSRARALIMRDYPDAIFVSIHCNSFPEERYGGLQVFYPKASTDGKKLADEIQNSVKENVLKDNDRKAQSATRSIYLINAASITTVIVECGFLTNPYDLQMLIQPSHQKEIADAITIGIDRYFNLSEEQGGQ